LCDQLVAQQKHSFIKVLVGVSRFSPCEINLSRNKNISYGLKKIVAKSRARVYFEEKFWLCRPFFIKLTTAISALHFLNPQKMLITQGEKRETSTKTYNETMLRDKLRVFASRISLPIK